MSMIAYKHAPEHPSLLIQRGKTAGCQTVITVGSCVKHEFMVDAHIALSDVGIVVVERRAAFFQSTLILLSTCFQTEATPIIGVDGVTLYTSERHLKPLSISAKDGATLEVVVTLRGIAVRERSSSGTVDRHTSDRAVWKVVAETRLDRTGVMNCQESERAAP